MKGTRGTVFFLAALVAGAAWWIFSGNGHLPRVSAGETGITVSAITVTGSNPVPGQADAFYGGEGTSVTFSVTVKNTGGSDIEQTLQNQFVRHRYSADDPSVPWKYLGSLDKPIFIPLVGIKKGESKTIILVNESLYRNTLYLNFRVDETYLIHKANEPSIESPMAVIKILDKPSSSLQPASGAGNPPAGTPAGTKTCERKETSATDVVPYPPEKTSTRLYWLVVGTGERARAFLNCEMRGGEEASTCTPDPDVRRTCRGDKERSLGKGDAHYYSVTGISAITPTAPPAKDDILVTVGSPPPPPTDTPPLRGLPEPTPPQKPRYQEL